METGTGVDRMRIVGGSLALDFINTRSGPLEGPPDDDALASYDDLVAWGRYVGTVTDTDAARLRRHARTHPGDAQAAFQRALGIREYLDEVFRAFATGGHPSAPSLRQLRDDEADALAHAELVDAADAYEWRWTADHSPERPLWPVVHAAAELMTTGPLERIKGCAGCRFLFIDASKNRSRRWCSMDDCGTAEKVRRYVARRAAARR